GAGDERGALLNQQTNIVWVKAVNVLHRVDGVEHALLGLFAHSFRQRRLHKNAVDGVIRVEGTDEGERVRERRRLIEPEELSAATRVVHGLDLVANVDFRGGIGAGQDHAQAGRAAMALRKGSNARRQTGPNLRRACDTIKTTRYAFSPDAFVKPNPTAHTAIATARNFNPNVSAWSAVTLISDHLAVVSFVMPNSVKKPRMAMQAALKIINRPNVVMKFARLCIDDRALASAALTSG